MDFLKIFWGRVIGSFNPNDRLGGLEAADNHLQFIELRGGRIIQASIDLPVGVIESGVVKNRAELVSALRALRKEIKLRKSKSVDVVLTIPANNIYVQTFNVPAVGDKDLSEVAELNMRMISPIDVDSAYYGWQSMNDGFDELTNQKELLAAFVDRKVIDEYVSALQEAGYSVAAVESSTISLSRSLYANKLLDVNVPYLAVQFLSAGMYFMILRGRSVVFNFFSPWAETYVGDKSASFESIDNLIDVEVRRLLNFYSSHWGGQIDNIAIITPVLQNELSAAVRKSFPLAKIQLIDSEKAGVAYGAALRGLIPRSRDLEVSVNNITAHEAYRGDQILEYLKFWRSIVLTIFVALLALFVGSDVYLHGIVVSESNSKNVSIKSTDLAQLNNLEESAEQFNNMVSIIASAEGNQTKVSWLINAINSAASADGVSLSRVYIQTAGKSGLVVGYAGSNTVATDFKDKLAAIPQLTQVQIPFSTITVAANGTVNFTVTFGISSFESPADTATSSSS
ncbi:hypothetical protein M1295_03250 [Patescibacteria group bacterium]|nr:hypothetical protein [Patescibacteria group bacterium]